MSSVIIESREKILNAMSPTDWVVESVVIVIGDIIDIIIVNILEIVVFIS